MTAGRIHRTINYLIAMVWVLNGFFCKVLNFVPRHGEIVAAILGPAHARFFTVLIGLLETGMAIWIITGIWSSLNVLVQIAVISVMNILEFLLVPHLLLWGRANILFAALFVLLIYYNKFYLRKNLASPA